jgi:hypothetical protein
MASNAGEEGWFNTQINAAALIAEINLLLDFISGRSDRTLGGGQQLRMPDGYTDYGAMLSEFFAIRSRASQSEARAKPEVGVKGPVDEAAPSGPVERQQSRGAPHAEENPYA